MCGILLKTKQSDHKQFEKALELLNHRGPDQTRIKNISQNQTFLGHTRLSILDLSPLAEQPMSKEGTSFELLFNGEIYNHKWLKQHHGLKTLSTGDTETLFQLYKRKGPEMFKELDGEFAIVIYDKQSKSIIAARDPMGIKPLYYWKGKGGEITFSSEIKPILKFTGRFFNEQAFLKFLNFGYLPGNETMFYGIYKVPPGTWVQVSEGGEMTFHKYFDLALPEGENSTVIDVRTSVIEAVKKRMLSDVPISVTLSGGLDSSIVAAIMAENSSKPIRTYSLGFSEDSEELKKAKIVSSYLGTIHTEAVVTPEKAFEAIPRILEVAEEPMDKGSLIPSHFLASLINEKVTLIGEGADECFAGYQRHQEIKDWAFGLGNAQEYFRKHLQVFSTGEYKDLPDKDLLNVSQKNSFLLYDLLHEIPDYHNIRVDKAFMGSSIEARVPYLDPNVVKIALAVRYSQKVDPEKKILREAFWDKLPKEILERKKNALKIPYDEWVEKEEVKAVVLSSPLFSKDQMEVLYSSPKEERNRGRKLWLAYLSTLWYHKNFT